MGYLMPSHKISGVGENRVRSYAAIRRNAGLGGGATKWTKNNSRHQWAGGFSNIAFKSGRRKEHGARYAGTATLTKRSRPSGPYE